VSDTREQFEHVYQENYEAVQRYVARRVAPEAIQDVVSDTFLAAWRRYADLHGEPMPWLLGIARRTAANHRRSGSRRAALRERLSTEQRRVPSAGLDDRDPRLAAALATLPDRDREALLLVAWDGLEHHVAATVMGCSTGAFTVRVHRARRKLEHALQDDERSPIDVTQEARSLP
jgi:RNA polymerase sigma factor (sigma-70 family)